MCSRLGLMEAVCSQSSADQRRPSREYWPDLACPVKLATVPLPAAASDMYTCPSLTTASQVQKNNKLPLLALTCGQAGDAYARLGCWFQRSARQHWPSHAFALG